MEGQSSDAGGPMLLFLEKTYKSVLFSLCALICAASLTACLDTTEVTESVDPDSVSISRIDTVYQVSTQVDTVFLSSNDTLYISTVDTIVSVEQDTLVHLDTLIHLDTLHQIDTLIIAADTVVFMDTVVTKDSIFKIDTLISIDTVVVFDSVFRIDTVYSKDTILLKDTLFVTPEQAYNYFLPIEDVLENLQDDEKITLVLRHAERGDDYSVTGGLNDNGINQSRNLGQKIKGFEDVRFYHTIVTRTEQTCQYIAEGMGLQEYIHDSLPELRDNWLVKDEEAYATAKSAEGSSWKLASRWVYTGKYSDIFYSLDEKMSNLEAVIAPNYDSMKKLNIAISHDLLMVPYVAWASQRQINLRFYETGSNKQWINYLAGVAIIVDSNNHVRHVPVRGLSRGTLE